jgi:hypothetical protein
MCHGLWSPQELITHEHSQQIDRKHHSSLAAEERGLQLLTLTIAQTVRPSRRNGTRSKQSADLQLGEHGLGAHGVAVLEGAAPPGGEAHAQNCGDVAVAGLVHKALRSSRGMLQAAATGYPS